MIQQRWASLYSTKKNLQFTIFSPSNLHVARLSHMNLLMTLLTTKFSVAGSALTAKSEQTCIFHFGLFCQMVNISLTLQPTQEFTTFCYDLRQVFGKLYNWKKELELIVQTFSSNSLSCCCSLLSCWVAFLRSLSFSSLIKRSRTRSSHRCLRSISFNTASCEMKRIVQRNQTRLLTIIS